MSRSVPMHTSIGEWITREALAVADDSPAALDSVVDTIIEALGPSVALLGIGEALHGGEEILLLRNRMFQRLVERHGYSAIAFESSLPRSQILSEYIAGRGAASYDEIQEAGWSYGFRGLEANRELVEWMRRYNADPNRRVELRLYGCDAPTSMVNTDSPRQVLFYALEYLATIDRERTEPRRARIEELIGADSAWENPAALMDPAQAIGTSPAANALRTETEDLIAHLEIRRPELIAASTADRFWEALHYARMARQLLTYHAELARASDDRVATLLGIRDVMIASTLEYIVERERGRGGVMVFMHNRHVQRSRATWQLGPLFNVWWPAGAHLDATLGGRYAVIGTGVGVSEGNGIAAPEPETLESRLAGRAAPLVAIPTHRGQALPASEIAALPRRTGSVRNTSYFPLDADSFTDFDWLIVLDTLTYTRGAIPLP